MCEETLGEGGKKKWEHLEGLASYNYRTIVIKKNNNPAGTIN